MIVVDLLLNMFFNCFAFSFMRLFFWLIEPKISKIQQENSLRDYIESIVEEK